MMYLIMAFSQKFQWQPGSRRSQEVEIIWTDGSTNNKLARGGAGIFIEDNIRAIEEKLNFAAGEICFSFRAEGVTMLRAL